jgi:hypothetical protein
MDVERRIVVLMQHYLAEKGWTLALRALEEDSQIQYAEHTLPSGALAAMVQQRDSDDAARAFAALSLRTKYVRRACTPTHPPTHPHTHTLFRIHI